jgi:pimeloyl-ACP methyl ester carboxylesterase
VPGTFRVTAKQIASGMKLLQKLAVSYVRTRFRILSSFSKTRAAEYAFTIFCTPQHRNRKKLPPLFEEAEKLRFTFQQYTIAGYRWNKGAGRKALILHGFESSAINFGHYIQPLTEKGYEVLAFDAPAHGRSSGKQINAVIYRDFVRQIDKEYGPVQSFIAHSFGGLALCLALSETQHSDDYRVALVAPATESTTAFEHFFRLLGVSDPAIREKIEQMVLRVSGHPVAWFSIHRTLDHIRAKILWAHDKKDPVTPFRDVEVIKKENYPGIRFVITEGLGHRRIYRDAKVVRMIIDFL